MSEPASPAALPPLATADDPDAPGWTRAPATAGQVRTDAGLAAALFAGAVLSMALCRTAGIRTDPATGPVSVLLLAAVVAPLAWRRRFGWPVLVVVSAAFVVGQVVGVPEYLVSNIALFISFYTVGAWEPARRRARWVRTVVVVAMLGWLTVAVFRAVTGADDSGGLSRSGAFSPLAAYLVIQVLTNVAYFAGAWGFGEHAWSSAREYRRSTMR